MAGTRDTDKKSDKPKRNYPSAANDSFFRLTISNKLSAPLESKAKNNSWWISNTYLEYWERGNPIQDGQEKPLGYPALADLETGEIRFAPCRNGVPKEQFKLPFLDKHGQPFKLFIQTEAKMGGITGNVHIDLAMRVGWYNKLRKGTLVGIGIIKGVYYKINEVRGRSGNANCRSIEYASEILEEMCLDPNRSPMPGFIVAADNLRRLVPYEILTSISQALLEILPATKETIILTDPTTGKIEEVKQINKIRDKISTNEYVSEYKEIVSQKILTKPVNQLQFIYQHNYVPPNLYTILDNFIKMEKRFERNWIGQVENLLKEKDRETKESQAELEKERDQKLINILLNSEDANVTGETVLVDKDKKEYNNLIIKETPIIQVINQLIRKLELNDLESFDETMAFLGWLIKQKNYNLEQEIKLCNSYPDSIRCKIWIALFYCSGFSILAKIGENDKEFAEKNPFQCSFLVSEYNLIVRMLKEGKVSTNFINQLLYTQVKPVSIYMRIIQCAEDDNFILKNEIPNILVHIIKERNYNLASFTEEERNGFQQMMVKNPHHYFNCIIKDPEFLNIEFFNKIFSLVKRLYQLPIILEEAKNLSFGLIGTSEAQMNKLPFSDQSAIAHFMYLLTKTPNTSPMTILMQLVKDTQTNPEKYSEQPYNSLFLRIIKAYNYDLSMLLDSNEKENLRDLLAFNNYRMFKSMFIIDPSLYDHAFFRNLIINGHKLTSNQIHFPDCYQQIDFIFNELKNSKDITIMEKNEIITTIMSAIANPQYTYLRDIFSIELFPFAIDSSKSFQIFEQLKNKYLLNKVHASLTHFKQKNDAYKENIEILNELITELDYNPSIFSPHEINKLKELFQNHEIYLDLAFSGLNLQKAEQWYPRNLSIEHLTLIQPSLHSLRSLEYRNIPEARLLFEEIVNNLSTSPKQNPFMNLIKSKKKGSFFIIAVESLLKEINFDITPILTEEEQNQLLQKLSDNDYQLYLYLVSNIPSLYEAPLFQKIKTQGFSKQPELNIESKLSQSPLETKATKPEFDIKIALMKLLIKKLSHHIRYSAGSHSSLIDSIVNLLSRIIIESNYQLADAFSETSADMLIFGTENSDSILGYLLKKDSSPQLRRAISSMECNPTVAIEKSDLLRDLMKKIDFAINNNTHLTLNLPNIIDLCLFLQERGADWKFSLGTNGLTNRPDNIAVRALNKLFLKILDEPEAKENTSYESHRFFDTFFSMLPAYIQEFIASGFYDIIEGKEKEKILAIFKDYKFSFSFYKALLSTASEGLPEKAEETYSAIKQNVLPQERADLLTIIDRSFFTPKKISDKIDKLQDEHAYLTEHFLNVLLEEKNLAENLKIIEEFKLVEITQLSSLTNQKGNTLLHLAAINKQKNVMDLLITKGFNTTIKNQEGLTAQHYFPTASAQRTVSMSLFSEPPTPEKTEAPIKVSPVKKKNKKKNK